MTTIRKSNAIAALAEVIWHELRAANAPPGEEPSDADIRRLTPAEERRLATRSAFLGGIAAELRTNAGEPVRNADVFELAYARARGALESAVDRDESATQGTVPAHALDSIRSAEVRALVHAAMRRTDELAAIHGLTATAHQYLRTILRLLVDHPEAPYYLDKLDLLLATPDAPSSGAGDSVRNMQLRELRRAVGKAQRAESKRGYDPRAEEHAVESGPQPLRKYEPHDLQRPGEYLRIDRSDESNLRVKVKVFLRGARPVVAQVKALEDAIEKHVRIPGFVVDLELVDQPGRDVYEVDANPDEWPSNYNWVGTAEQLGHELFHLMGLDDEYRGESQAENAYLPMEARLEYLLWALRNGPPHADAERGIMFACENKPLPRQARAAVGLSTVPKGRATS
ncbi:MAG: hypothetical protein AAB426_06095 [Myxococcota bacterium]